MTQKKTRIQKTARGARVMSDIVGVAVFGTLGAGILLICWLLMTEVGTRTVIRTAQQVNLIPFEVEAVDGRIVRRLKLLGVHVETPGAVIDADLIEFKWSPAALFRRDVEVLLLRIGQLSVRQTGAVPEEPEEKPASEGVASIPDLPIGLGIDELRVDRFALYGPPDESGKLSTEPTQVVENFSLKGLQFRAGRLTLGQLVAEHALSGPIELSARAKLAGQSVELDQFHLDAGDGKPASLSGNADFSLADFSVRADIGLDNFRWPLTGDTPPQVSIPQGKIHVEGPPSDLIAQAHFTLAPQAEIGLDGGLRDGQIRARLDWKTLIYPFTGTPQVVSDSGSLTFNGTPTDYQYELSALARVQGHDSELAASGIGSSTHADIKKLKILLGEGSISGKAMAQWSPALNVDAKLELSRLDPGMFAAEWPGRLNGKLSAKTSIVKEQPETRFQLALERSRLRDFPLQANIDGVAAGSQVRIKAARIKSGQSLVNLTGQVTPPFNLKAQIDSPSLAEFYPGLDGSANLDASVKGSVQDPHVVATGTINALKFGKTTLKSADLDIDLDLNGAWKFQLEAHELGAETKVERASVSLDGSHADHVLSLELKSDAADVELAARGALEIDQMRWSGQISEGRFAPADLAPWTLQEAANLSADPENQDLEPACWWSPDSRICARLKRSPDKLRAGFRIENFNFEYFKPFLPSGLGVTGGVEGTAFAEIIGGELKQAKADLVTKPITVSRDGHELLNAQAGTIVIEELDDRAVANADLPIQGGTLKFDATLAGQGADYSQRELSGQLNVDLDDLGFVRLASEEIDSISGRLHGRIDLSGTLAQPRTQGEIRLTDGNVVLDAPGLEIEQITAKILTRDQEPVSLTASAESGGGRIDVDGKIASGGNAEIRITGKDFQAANMGLARAWISPDLNVKRSAQKLEVSGVIEVPRAEITPKSFDSGIGPSSDQIIVSDTPPEPLPAPTQLYSDVEIKLGDAVRVDGFGLKTRLAGSVRSIERPAKVGRALGEIRLVDGYYKAYGQDLQIDRGRLLYTGQQISDPAIEVRAIRRPRKDVEVGVQVRGQIQDPAFTLFSDPAMPRERQLSWLVLGRSLEEGTGQDDRAALANAALTMGLGGTDKLAQSLKGGLNLDDISLGSQPGESAQEAQLTVGKYLSPELYVSYGVGIFQPGGVFKLLYDLGRGFKISTESGVATGGDLLYSIEQD